MKKTLLLTIFTVLTFFCTYSQDNPLSLGIRGGVNLSNMSFENLDTDARVGYQFGVVAEYELPNNFFLNGSLNISSKGVKSKGEGSMDFNGDGLEDRGSVKSTLNATYLELPILVGYKVAVTDDTKIKFMAGPYIAYGIGGKTSDKANVSLQNPDGSYTKYSETNKIDTFSDETLKSFDAGLSGAVGVEYGKFTFTLGYEYGLTDISRTSTSIRNRNAFAAIGYTFF